MAIVETEDRGSVRHVVLNRPEKRNAMNGEVVSEVGLALKAAANDPDVLCVVVRGAGAMFSSGMDFHTLGELPRHVEMLRAFRRECIEAWNLAEEMIKPTIASIHGGCIGGAMELALACDLRVMATDAVIGMPETRVGLIPDVGGSSRLPAVVGLGRAKELIMTARLIGAEEAERIGLLNRVVEPAELEGATEALVAELLANSHVAVGRAKRVIDASARPAIAQTLEMEIAVQEFCVAAARESGRAQADTNVQAEAQTALAG